MALAGVGLALVGLRALLLADALSFVALSAAVAAVTASCKGSLAAPAAHEGAGRRGRLLPEVAVLRSRAVLGPAGFALVLTVVVSTSFEGVVCLFYLRDVARLTPSVIGAVLATWSIGMAASAAGNAHARRKASRGALPVTSLGMGASITAVSRLVGPVPISAAYVVGGVSNGVFSVALANSVHDGVPKEQLGATWAVLGSLINAGSLIGFVAGGFGSSHARGVMTAAGAVCAAAGLLALAARARTSATSKRTSTATPASHQ
jgi:hypothetical protein